jgi:fatty acid desaturase
LIVPIVSTLNAWPVFAILAALLMRALDTAYHRDAQRILQRLHLAPQAAAREPCYRALDPVFALLPFVWNWFEIAAATALAKQVDHTLGYTLLTLFAGARIRALQEVGHTAVHLGLCRSKRWQWGLANVLFQYPCFKPNMRARCISHVHQHHRATNQPSDPNIARFRAIGFVPPMSLGRFQCMLFYPFTPRGLLETLRLMVRATASNQSIFDSVVRANVVLVVVCLFVAIGGWQGLVFAYLLPLLTVYPWFSWISLLVEHRWFVECHAKARFARECINGRPTDYSGVSGWLIKHFVLPASDHYHLAHSLYPHVRWNYLAAIDRKLKARDPAYGTFRTEGLFWSNGSRPSALLELRARMTANADQDRAAWAVAAAEQTR